MNLIVSVSTMAPIVNRWCGWENASMVCGGIKVKVKCARELGDVR